MKKKIEIKKKIDFASMIGEICAISLDQQLKFIDDENVEGNLLLTGRYKSSVASQIEEDFSYEIPVHISLTEKVDSNTGNVSITDFYYDIQDSNSILCHIEMEVEGEEILEERECDGDPISEKEIEIPHIDTVEKEEIETKIETEERVENHTTEENECFFNLDSSKETYGTFIVYIVRQNETVNSIIEKYDTTLEEIEKYNDLKDLSIGSKIIIPITHEKEN